ncbi:hypothetical protein [Streptomyces rimosus]|uniref:hypothetical protein n=1 Tax=Streptomyces rimosus TaxID=1927 RepID=UPI000B22D0F6|nr:hypothetical protein [Streptomyces rimosus]
MTGYVNLADSTVRSGQQIGTLPQGYRPKTTKRLIVASTANGTIIRMDVNPDGAMRLYPSSAAGPLGSASTASPAAPSNCWPLYADGARPQTRDEPCRTAY